MKRSREVAVGDNIPPFIVVLKPHHSNFACEGKQLSSGDGSTLISHFNSTPEILSSSFSTEAMTVNSIREVSDVLYSSSKGIQPADCSAGGVSESLISVRPGIIVHGDGDNLGEQPEGRGKKEKRKKHRPKVVEIEKPGKNSKMKTLNRPQTPQQKSLGWKKGKVIGRSFATKKMVADSLGDENDWEEADDQPRPASTNNPITPSSRIQIDGDELAAKIDVAPSFCSGNAQMAQNSAFEAAHCSTEVNISIDELLQELVKLPEKPSSPLLLKEELLQLNMESSVDALMYIVDNINIPCLLYFVNQSRRMARIRLKDRHKLKEGFDHSTNEVLEKFIYLLKEFLPFLVMNDHLSQAARRKFNNRQKGGGRKNITGSKEQQNRHKKSSISKAHSDLQIITSMHRPDFTSRFKCMGALRMAPANSTINGKLTPNWQNSSSNHMELALENIMDMFRVLDINKVYEKDALTEPHRALVPFVGDRDGTIVPYDGPFQKRKQKHCRVEVLLDPVSDGVLKMLQEKEGDDDVKGMDFSMVKWWDNERRVFVGRAKSFIARMDLILGNRRFSPWKGSIVDSVIGVFLTQNVSDHLSSSAFMSLAAKFPLHSRVEEGSSSKSKPSEQHEESSNDDIRFLKGISILSNYDDQCSAVIKGDGHHEVDSASQPYNHRNFVGFTRIENYKSFMELDVEGCVAKHAASLSNSFVVNAENGCRDLSQVLSQSEGWSKLNASFNDTVDIEKEVAASCSNLQMASFGVEKSTSSPKKKVNTDGEAKIDWEWLRKKAYCNIDESKKVCGRMNSVNWEAVRNADVSEISAAIRERGMNNLLAERIKDFLNRLVRDHGSIDLEWLRNISPDEAKMYLLSIRGLGLKSVECIRLLALQNVAFPVDTNVARISVRLGWVPLKPLPEFLQLHLLELYPVMDSVQKYIWPRLCKLDQKTLYELHYHMITFGKVFCTKIRPNCRVCPMRGECKHFTSAKPALPAPEDKQVELPLLPSVPLGACSSLNPIPQLQYEEIKLPGVLHDNYQPTPIIEEPPPSPSLEIIPILDTDIEEAFYEVDEIPAITLNIENFAQNYQNFVQKDNLKGPDGDISKALVEISAEVASIPISKLKNASGLRTEHYVYELPDSHPLLKELQMDQREPDDQFPYLLAIWIPGETAQSTEPPETFCESLEKGTLCERETCFSCNNRRELEALTIRGTLLIPCRTAMKGRFPLNGTYFQINEVFADHDSSRNPIHVPRSCLWNLPRRMVYFGTSVAAIFRGFSSIEPIQYCFSRGFICVRGFDRKTREPKPLYARLHLPRSKAPNNKRPWARQEE